MKLVIGNKNYSSWSLRPWILLRHFAIEFEEIRLNLDSPEFNDRLKTYNVAGKVPVLIDNNLTIWDSMAICEYLSEQYLDGNGYPQDITARAQCRSVCAEMHSGFMQIRQTMPMNCRASRTIQFSDSTITEIARVDQLWQQLRQQYNHRGDWLFGDFSIADCMFAPMASRFNTYQATLSAIASDYVEQILQHPQIRLWYQQSADEPETLASEETGHNRQPV